MSRVLKRVPLDFQAPLNQVWKGYKNPHRRPCPGAAPGICHGGRSSAWCWMEAVAGLLVTIGEEAAYNDPATLAAFASTRRVYPCPGLQTWEDAPRNSNGELLSLDQELAEVIDGLSKTDLADMRTFTQARTKILMGLLEAAGVDFNIWGKCRICGGLGLNPGVVDAYRAWTRTEPPVGEGWQLWETVSEGSPISPVFAGREEFVDYLHRVLGHTQEAAEAFCDHGWAPSAVLSKGRVYTNINALDMRE